MEGHQLLAPGTSLTSSPAAFLWSHWPPYSRYALFRAFPPTIPSAQKVLPPDICMNHPLISFRSLLKWIKFLSLFSNYNLPLASPPSISLSPLPLVSPHTTKLTHSECVLVTLWLAPLACTPTRTDIVVCFVH